MPALFLPVHHSQEKSQKTLHQISLEIISVQRKIRKLLSEMSEREKINSVRLYLYMWNLKNKPVTIAKEASQVYRRKLVVDSNEESGGGIKRRWGIKRYKLTCIKY